MANNEGFDPDHTYEKRIEKEKDEMWEKLKYIKPEHTTVDTDEILKSLKRISSRCAKMNKSYEKMDASLDRLDKAVDEISKTLKKMDNEKK